MIPVVSSSCEQGWIGSGCDECVPRSGCEHGTCSGGVALSCHCEQGWLGPLCNCPRCKEGISYQILHILISHVKSKIVHEIKKY